MKSKDLPEVAILTVLCFLGVAPQVGAVRTQRLHVSPAGARLDVGHANASQHAGNSSPPHRHELTGNFSFMSRVRGEIEYELHLHGGNETVVRNKLMLAVITAMGWGFCGCDRCFLGQIAAGVLKGLTLGGLGFWHFADFLVIAINIFMVESSIDMFFFKASFVPSTVDPARWTFLIILVLNCVFQAWSSRKSPHHEAKALCRRHSAELGERAERLLGPPSQAEIIALFHKFDGDGSGQLDSQELENALLYIGVRLEDIDAKKQLIDLNNDGKVDIAEFAKAFEQGQLEPPKGGSTGEAPS